MLMTITECFRIADAGRMSLPPFRLLTTVFTSQPVFTGYI